MFISDYTYAELQKEKLHSRQEDPIRYDVLTMILAGAGSLAKKENREVTKQDLVAAVKTEIRDSEKAIELIESKGGNASKQKAELFIYKSFIPSTYTEEETKAKLQVYFDVLPEENRQPQNMGKVIQYIKAGLGEEQSLYDMKIVSKLVKEYLV